MHREGPIAYLALAIFFVTMAAIVAFARRIPEWCAALGGAFLMVATGIEPFPQAALALTLQWNVLFFFAGLGILVAVAESTGVFGFLAHRAQELASHSALKLLALVLGMSAVVTIFLTNDAAVLVVTPLVAELVTRLRLPVGPFAIGVALMANAASAILPISNPSNFILAEALHLRLAAYLYAVGLPAIAALVAVFGALLVLYRAPLRTAVFAAPKQHESFDKLAMALLACSSLAMIVASADGIPVGGVAAGSAVLVVLAIGVANRTTNRAVLSKINASLVLLAAGLFVVVDGLRNSGALAVPVSLFARVIEYHASIATVLSMGVTAAASNVLNNLPVAMISAQMLHQSALAPQAAHAFAAGAIIGTAAGANLTVVGSLSTLLVLIELRRRNIPIGVRQFTVPGIIATLAAIIAATLMFTLVGSLV
ncbi:MAG: arsenic transporter [Vulcanimicrobiaceae bacterium]